MAPFLSPPPRILTIDHPKGAVLLIATARTPALVPTTSGGRLAYWLRIGDNTVQAPDYLISDLMLGHRQHPVLSPLRAHPDLYPDHFTLSLEISNEGLSTARGVVAGIVSFVGPGVASFHPRPSPALLPFIRRDITKTGDLAHQVAVMEVLRPFQSATLQFGQIQHHLSSRNRVPWRAALYILSEVSPPTWYQLDYAGVTGEAPAIVPVTGSKGPFVGWDMPEMG